VRHVSPPGSQETGLNYQLHAQNLEPAINRVTGMGVIRKQSDAAAAEKGLLCRHMLYKREIGRESTGRWRG